MERSFVGTIKLLFVSIQQHWQTDIPGATPCGGNLKSHLFCSYSVINEGPGCLCLQSNTGEFGLPNTAYPDPSPILHKNLMTWHISFLQERAREKIHFLLLAHFRGNLRVRRPAHSSPDISHFLTIRPARKTPFPPNQVTQSGDTSAVK